MMVSGPMVRLETKMNQQYYLEGMQIGLPALIVLSIAIVLLGLLVTKIIENYSVVFKWLLGLAGIAVVLSVAMVVGMAIKAIFHLNRW